MSCDLVDFSSRYKKFAEVAQKREEVATEMLCLVLLGLVASAAAAPCCMNCTQPEATFFSVVTKNGYCGVSCIEPRHYHAFKLLEPNLTRSTDGPRPCAEQLSANGMRYTDYAFTENHSIPGLVSVGVDFWAQSGAPDHTCCAPSGNLLCFAGKPSRVLVDGVHYCCPRGATATQPCPHAAESVVESATEVAAESATEVAAACPADLASMRSARVVSSFDAASLTGMWHEQAYIDVAQVGSACQTLNGTLTAAGELSMRFRVKYGPVPFALTETYTPMANASSGLYWKRARVPGGGLLKLRTVVVDVSPAAGGVFVLFSCAGPIKELVVASRTSTLDNETLAESLALAHRLGVPFEDADVKLARCDSISE